VAHSPFRRALSLGPALLFASIGLLPAAIAQTQQEPPPAAQVTPDPWPKLREIGGVKYTLYQPQLDKWNGYDFEAHAAVAVLPVGAKDPVFGAIEITANTEVAKVSRTVHFSDIKIVRAIFPSAPDRSARYQQAFQTIASNGPSTMSLDRLEIALAITGEEKKARAVPVKNEPPRFVFSQSAAVLVPIDGTPVWRTIQGTRLERVLNTRALVVLDDSTGRFYVHLFDGFVEAPSIAGPWTLATKVPPSIVSLEASLAKQNVIDPMTGPTDPKTKEKASLKHGVPDVVVTTTPTELLVTEGPPDWVPIEGTMLLYVKNTTGNIFKNLNDQLNYVLVTGRWFHAPDLAGPWQYIAGTELPPDFTRIPDDSPKENVKAAVPYTTQADEALIANEIPQTATISRAKASFTPEINGGSPDMRHIPDTPLNYVFNSPSPIIMVSPSEWYAVQSGIWFTSISATGPWLVAASVPPVIYSIPVSSPLHYVTYVRVYSATPQYVVVGYTPGYLGTVVAPGGVIVYGTGYTYVSYVGPTIWYPPPVTYGYAANPYWTPWTGWAMGFGMGMAFGAAIAGGSSCCWGYCPAPYWGAMPYYPSYAHYGAYGGAYWGPHGSAAVWGPGGWAATSGNVYHQWGATGAVTRTSGGYNAWTGNAWSTQVGHSYNSMTGRVAAGERGAVQNVYTGNYAYGGRGATYNPNTGVTARGGTATYGNAYSGSQNTAKWGQVSGPAGQTGGYANVNGNHYADHDGNVYRNTGSGWQSYDNGSWNSVNDADRTQSLNAEQNGRWAGDQRSAGSSWGSSSWGGGFNRSSDGDSGFGGGGWNRGSSGWDRGGSGWSGDGASRSWGGGSFGGGGRSWGGGGRR